MPPRPDDGRLLPLEQVPASCEKPKRKYHSFTLLLSLTESWDEENGVFSAAVNGGVEDSVMGSGLP